MVIEMESIRELPWVFSWGYGIYLCRVCDKWTEKPEDHQHGINVEAWRARECPI